MKNDSTSQLDKFWVLGFRHSGALTPYATIISGCDAESRSLQRGGIVIIAISKRSVVSSSRPSTGESLSALSVVCYRYLLVYDIAADISRSADGFWL